MYVLAQFLFRLSFGLALGMAVTSPQRVTAGYFRVHLQVVMGLSALGLMVAFKVDAFSIWPPLAATVLSYIGSVIWLYQKPRPGRVVLVLVAVCAIIGAWQALEYGQQLGTAGRVLWWFDPVSGGLVLGVTMAAMLLGHWYLNTPTMELAPLRRLLKLITVALALRIVLCGTSLVMQITMADGLTSQQWLFLALRWLSGLLGGLALVWMTARTLDIPNTQSATGILYVAVIATFLGELTAQLLSAEAVYPL